MADETTIPDGAVVTKDITYATRPTGPVKLDLIRPAGDGPFPIVFWIHGGAWKLGDKAAWPHMNFLVEQKFAVVNVEYRFSQVATYPAQLDDCRAAVAFIVAHADEYKLDAGRIAVTGESAGGHLASLVGLTQTVSTTSAPSLGRVRAVIDLFGPSDLGAMGGNVKADLAQLVGKNATAEQYKEASPISHVGKGAPPFLILHGTADPLVPIAQSEQLAEALKKAGVSVKFEKVQGAGHAGPMFWTMPYREEMLAFLKTNLDIH